MKYILVVSFFLYFRSSKYLKDPRLKSIKTMCLDTSFTQINPRSLNLNCIEQDVCFNYFFVLLWDMFSVFSFFFYFRSSTYLKDPRLKSIKTMCLDTSLTQTYPRFFTLINTISQMKLPSLSLDCIVLGKDLEIITFYTAQTL